jgi:lipoprotein-releasing system ATP-binding protein
MQMSHALANTGAVAEEAIFQGASAEGVMLRAEALRKVFYSGKLEIAPLDGIDFTVERGEMVSITGPSGSGKSTFLHLLAALDTPTSGAVYFAGNSLRSLSESGLASYRNRVVGFVWQRHHLLPDFTAVENVAMPLLIDGKARGAALRTAETWLGEVGLADRAGQRAAELSGGEQQRVAIARALANEPELLLADEPTGDLDEQNAEAIFELMQKLHSAHQLTSILATHNLSLARRTDRTFSLQCGKLTPGTEVPTGLAAWTASGKGTGNTQKAVHGVTRV